MTTIGSDYVADIAIIGFTGRFPGAPDPETFWANLCAGKESVSFFSDAELEAAGVSAALRDRPDYVRAGAILDDIDQFDAAFFTLTGREAEIMDPQHRVFLEAAWTALEHAGYTSDTYPGLIGIYAGVGLSSYMLFHLLPHHGAQDTAGSYQTLIVNDKDYLATRTSYKLNLKGPSVTVQTACSTSLVAVHLACQSLLNGECDMALAGGVSIWVPQKAGYVHQTGMILSPDGHCRAFDAEAQGTIRGNGVGVVVLKPLSAAIADGDTIHAVIKGSAINNDGAMKIGYTAPSMENQREVIIQAQALARVPADTITYVEAHGTGTPLGDPVEIAALTQAFRTTAQQNQFCAIGSVKTNIGHLSEAAGIAGLIKTILMLKHRQIPPSLHFQTPNPKIDFANSPFFVNTQLREWHSAQGPRRAGVSSFGIGGTNAHLIVEEAPPLPAASAARPQQLLLLSARSHSALDSARQNLARYIEQHPDLNLADLAYTLQVGRKQFSHRLALVCADRSEALRILTTSDPEHLLTTHQEASNRPVVFLFPGQGTQYVEMGGDLYAHEPVFRAAIDRCAELLHPYLKLDLRTILYPCAAQREEASARLNQTGLAQAALFATEYALASLWMAWGIRPQALIGHSLGEYVAACLAAVMTLEEALRLVAIRGQLMQSLPRGAMLAVELGEAALLPRLSANLALAAVNGAQSCVVAGPTEAIKALQEELAQEQIGCRLLHTSHAFHSAMMEPIIEPFLEQLHQIRLQPPQIPYISNVTGDWISPAQATDPSYWATHLRQTVRFHDGLQTLLQAPDRILLEVGPGHTLSTLARQHPTRTATQAFITTLRHANERVPELTFLFQALGKLWLAGAPVDWAGFAEHEQRRRLPLPTYPFERQRYWVDPPALVTAAPALPAPVSSSSDVARWLYLPQWRVTPPPAATTASFWEATRCWLLFTDSSGLGQHLAQQLKQAGQQVISVAAGTQFSRSATGDYTLAPSSAGDYQELLDDLASRSQRPDIILHCWSSDPPPTQAKPALLEQIQERGFYSLLFLAQAFGRRGTSDPCQLWVITSDTQAVSGDETLCPEKATVLGPCRVIPQEYPQLLCRAIDLTQSDMETALPQVVEQVLNEIAAGSETAESLLAYRGQQRWTLQFVAAQADHTQETLRLRAGGVYLITGGLGGMGLALAQELAQTLRAKLVLVGRSGLPPRDSWAYWLTNPEQNPDLAARIRTVTRLEEAGAEVLIASADVASMEQMQQVLQQATQRFGAINGVIHAAGVAGGGFIQLKTAQQAAAVLGPKVQGTQVLATLLKDQPLDFMLLCSSLTALLAGVGQVDYTAANAFLDAYAQAQRAKGGPLTLAVNWDTWKEVGMAVRAAQQVPSNTPPLLYQFSHPLIAGCLEETDQTTIYVSQLSSASHWVLAEHRLHGRALLPGTAYLELARAACAPYADGRTLNLCDVVLLTPLWVAENEVREVRTILQRDETATRFVIASRDQRGVWQEHARGSVAWEEPKAGEQQQLATLINRYPLQGMPSPAEAGLQFGPRWQSLQQLRWQQHAGLACLRLPATFATDTAAWGLHPALLDVALGFATQLRPEVVYLPFSYKRLRIYAPLPATIYSHVCERNASAGTADTLSFDITLLDEQGNPLLEVEEYTLRRISQTSVATPTPAAQNRQLRPAAPGRIDAFSWQPSSRRAPSSGEVEIEVYATGLNFLDVLAALGAEAYGTDTIQLGRECAGRVVAVGADVSGFNVGDAVVATALDSFSEFVTVPVSCVAAKPETLNFEQAAAVPIAFMTAHYALHHLARLRRGERVLIHAAAGGVGLAAVQLAQRIGAEIFATAGSPAKRTFLRSLGIDHVLDSRSLDFAQEVQQRTAGKGVDVVLNSLAGDFLSASLDALGMYGRFVEIGKRDIYENRPLEMKHFQKGLSFFAVHLNPSLPGYSALLQEVLDRFASGELQPTPHTTFPMMEAATAFLHMAAAKHIGKIVLSWPDKVGNPQPASAIDQSSPYLTTAERQQQAERPPQDYLNLAVGIPSRAGVEVFRYLLGQSWPQVIVSTQDWQARFNQAQRNSLFDYLALAQGTAIRRAAQQRPSLATPYVPPRNDVERMITEIWQDVLGIDHPGIHDNFFELGGTSLLGIQVISRLKDRLGIDLSPVRLFEGPSISALAEIISQEHKTASYTAETSRGKLRKENLRRMRQGGDQH